MLSAGDIASSLIDNNSNDTGPFTQAKGRRKKAKKGNFVTNSIVNDALQSAQSADLTQSTQAVSSPASSVLSFLNICDNTEQQDGVCYTIGGAMIDDSSQQAPVITLV